MKRAAKAEKTQKTYKFIKAARAAGAKKEAASDEATDRGYGMRGPRNNVREQMTFVLQTRLPDLHKIADRVRVFYGRMGPGLMMLNVVDAQSWLDQAYRGLNCDTHDGNGAGSRLCMMFAFSSSVIFFSNQMS